MKRLVPRAPVMLLTGVLFDAETVERFAERNIAAYVPKTTPLSRVLQEVGRLLERK